MTKSNGYKQQIENTLLQNDWEVIEISENTFWWCDEYWKVQTKFNASICFYLCFVTDPQYTHNRKKGQGIIEIRACTKFPDYWNDETSCIAQINMQKGLFDVKLKHFLTDISHYKSKLWI